MLIERRIPLEEVTRKRELFKNKKPEMYFQNIQVEGVADAMQRKFIIQSLKHRKNVVSLSDLKKGPPSGKGARALGPVRIDQHVEAARLDQPARVSDERDPRARAAHLARRLIRVAAYSQLLH